MEEVSANDILDRISNLQDKDEIGGVHLISNENDECIVSIIKQGNIYTSIFEDVEKFELINEQEGEKLTTELESHPEFHTTWISRYFPILKYILLIIGYGIFIFGWVFIFTYVFAWIGVPMVVVGFIIIKIAKMEPIIYRYSQKTVPDTSEDIYETDYQTSDSNEESRRVTVHVIDENGIPLPGKYIIINGITKNVKIIGETNENGTYSFNIPETEEKIEFIVKSKIGLSRKGTIEIDSDKDHIEGQFTYTTLLSNIRRIL